MTRGHKLLDWERSVLVGTPARAGVVNDKKTKKTSLLALFQIQVLNPFKAKVQ
jgi:hypothetical protein